MPVQVFKREEMLKVGKIAAHLGVSRQHVYNLIDRGELKPAFRFGGRQGLCVPLSAIVDFKQASQIEPSK